MKDFETKIDKTISLEIEEDTHDHFELPAEIVIYINEHFTEIIASGVGVGLVTNTLWDGLKALWKKVKRENCIELNFELRDDRTIEFDLNGNVDPNHIEAITEQIDKYLKDATQQKKDFANPDFKNQQDVKPRIRVRYNPRTEQLEVVNFTYVRNQIAEAFKRLKS